MSFNVNPNDPEVIEFVGIVGDSGAEGRDVRLGLRIADAEAGGERLTLAVEFATCPLTGMHRWRPLLLSERDGDGTRLGVKHSGYAWIRNISMESRVDFLKMLRRRMGDIEFI